MKSSFLKTTNDDRYAPSVDKLHHVALSNEVHKDKRKAEAIFAQITRIKNRYENTKPRGRIE